MKARILKLFFLLTATLLTLSAKSQTYPDYVITVKGDSIPCKVTSPPFGFYKYKTDGMDKAKTIENNEVKEFFFSRKSVHQRSIVIDSSLSPVFADVIEKGKINLYQIVTTSYGSASSTEWYAGKDPDHAESFKGNGILFGKGRTERKKAFANLLSDNKVVYDKFIADDKFSYDEILNIVHLYNTGKSLPIKIIPQQKVDSSGDFTPN